MADDYFLALAGSSMKCSWEVMSPDNTSAIREGFWLVGNLFTVLNICMLLWRKRRQKIVFPSYFLTVFILYKWQIKKCFLAAPKWSIFLIVIWCWTYVKLGRPSWSRWLELVGWSWGGAYTEKILLKLTIQKYLVFLKLFDLFQTLNLYLKWI